MWEAMRERENTTGGERYQYPSHSIFTVNTGDEFHHKATLALYYS